MHHRTSWQGNKFEAFSGCYLPHFLSASASASNRHLLQVFDDSNRSDTHRKICHSSWFRQFFADCSHSEFKVGWKQRNNNSTILLLPRSVVSFLLLLLLQRWLDFSTESLISRQQRQQRTKIFNLCQRSLFFLMSSCPGTVSASPLSRRVFNALTCWGFFYARSGKRERNTHTHARVHEHETPSYALSLSLSQTSAPSLSLTHTHTYVWTHARMLIAR